MLASGSCMSYAWRMILYTYFLCTRLSCLKVSSMPSINSSVIAPSSQRYTHTTHTHTRTHTHTYIYAHTHTLIHTHLHTYTPTHLHLCIHTYTVHITYTYTYRAHIYLHTFTYRAVVIMRHLHFLEILPQLVNRADHGLYI